MIRSANRRAAVTATIATLALVGVVGLFAGCSHNSGPKSTAGSAQLVTHDAAANAANPAAGADAPAANPAGRSSSGTSGATSGASDGGSPDSIVSQINLRSTAVIKTAELTIVTPNVAKAATAAIRIATQYGGGDSDEQQSLGSATNPTTDLTLQVPPDQLDAVLQALEQQIGTERSLQISSQDVTGQVADVSSRVSSAEASIAELQSLFAKATNVSDIIALESDLSQREADLESLQAQQRALSAQTSYATITVHLVAPTAPAVVKHHKSSTGFGHGLTHGWDAFTSALAWGLTGLGAVLPFLVLAALVAGAVVWARRRQRPAATPAAASADSGPGIVE